MKSLQSAVDCTSKKKRSTLEVTTSRNKRLERSLQCARSKVPHKWKNGRGQSSPENFIYGVTSWPTVLSMKAVVSLEGKYHHSSKRISWQLHITLKLLQLNWLHLYQHLLANIYFPTLINVWVPQSCVQFYSFKSDSYRCSTYDIRTSEDNHIRILP